MGLLDRLRGSGGSSKKYAADFKNAYESADVSKMRSIIKSWNNKSDDNYLLARALLAKIDDPSNFKSYLDEFLRVFNNKNQFAIQPLDGDEVSRWYAEKGMQMIFSVMTE